MLSQCFIFPINLVFSFIIINKLLFILPIKVCGSFLVIFPFESVEFAFTCRLGTHITLKSPLTI